MSANGLEQLRSWMATGERSPIHETLKVGLVEVERGLAVLAYCWVSLANAFSSTNLENDHEA